MSNKISIEFNTIDEAIEDISNGKVIIVVDDEDRENEGDFLAAAEMATPDMINFMATHGRGLICAPLLEDQCHNLGLDVMVSNNSDPMETAFTVSVDLRGQGVTTGISASDRAKTIRTLASTDAKSTDFSRPGHVFPLIAKSGGVLRRTGHTEAAVDFARLAKLHPSGVIVEVMNEDGTMARLPQLMEISKKFGIKIVSIEQLVAYRMANDSLITKKCEFSVKTRFGDFTLHAYEQITTNQIHIALTKGKWQRENAVLVRINATYASNDILERLIKNPTDDTANIFKKINEEVRGAVLFLNTYNSPSIFLERLEQMRQNYQDKKMTIPKMQIDDRDFGIGAQILNDLGIFKIKLISNSEPEKRVGIMGYDIEIVEKIPY